eukprot:363357-Chlamydomonas_euryale.AAC.22
MRAATVFRLGWVGFRLGFGWVGLGFGWVWLGFGWVSDMRAATVFLTCCNSVPDDASIRALEGWEGSRLVALDASHTCAGHTCHAARPSFSP